VAGWSELNTMFKYVSTWCVVKACKNAKKCKWEEINVKQPDVFHW
jgi:hypothetical protein